MPNILFSTLIWLSLYFDVLLMKQVLLGLLTAYLFFDCRKEIGKIILLIKKRI